MRLIVVVRVVKNAQKLIGGNCAFAVEVASGLSWKYNDPR
jgi:hypothetical protein